MEALFCGLHEAVSESCIAGELLDFYSVTGACQKKSHLASWSNSCFQSPFARQDLWTNLKEHGGLSFFAVTLGSFRLAFIFMMP